MSFEIGDVVSVNKKGLTLPEFSTGVVVKIQTPKELWNGQVLMANAIQWGPGYGWTRPEDSEDVHFPELGYGWWINPDHLTKIGHREPEGLEAVEEKMTEAKFAVGDLVDYFGSQGRKHGQYYVVSVEGVANSSERGYVGDKITYTLRNPDNNLWNVGERSIALVKKGQ